MEVNLQQKRKGLEVKIPDISKTLDVVRFLEARRVSSAPAMIAAFIFVRLLTVVR